MLYGGTFNDDSRFNIKYFCTRVIIYYTYINLYNNVYRGVLNEIYHAEKRREAVVAVQSDEYRVFIVINIILRTDKGKSVKDKKLWGNEWRLRNPKRERLDVESCNYYW